MSSLIKPYNLFEDLYRPFDSVFSSTPSMMTANKGAWIPPADISKDDVGYCIELEVPGFNNDDVSVEAHDGVLTITGKREQARNSEKDGLVRQERSYGRFSRQFSLPDGTITDEISATVKQGMLNIRIPYASPAEPKKIDVA